MLTAMLSQKPNYKSCYINNNNNYNKKKTKTKTTTTALGYSFDVLSRSFFPFRILTPFCRVLRTTPVTDISYWHYCQLISCLLYSIYQSVIDVRMHSSLYLSTFINKRFKILYYFRCIPKIRDSSD